MNFLRPLFVLSVMLIPLAVAVGGPPTLGGWKPIPDVKDKHVVEIGQYAISEYNNRSKAHLKFERVVSGETQVVAGQNYKLVIAAKGGHAKGTGKYEAIVRERAWENFKNLTSFKPIGHY